MLLGGTHHRAGPSDGPRRLTVLALAIALTVTVAPSALSDQGSIDGEPIDRFVVDTGTLTTDQLREGVQAAGGEIVRTDPVLDFAVVKLEDPESFGAETGSAPAADPRGQADVETPAFEMPSDPRFPEQWGPTELNAPQAWQINDDEPAVTVGIVDSGIDLDHPDLPAPGQGVELGYDYVEEDYIPNDENGHGSHVAGIVTAIRDNGEGIAGMTQADLYITRVFDADNSGWCSDFASGIRESVDAGVDVINFSGHCSIHWEPLADAIRYAEDNDVPVVVSAGNSQLSDPGSCVRHPAMHPSAIAVAATNPSTAPAYYSCQGPALELAAPGSLVLSTVEDGGYAYYFGTSMAAPHVASTVALLLEQDPSLSVEEIRDRMNETARDLGPPGHDTLYGHGMVDPVRAATGLPVFVPTD